jgi:hypothetical protein
VAGLLGANTRERAPDRGANPAAPTPEAQLREYGIDDLVIRGVWIVIRDPAHERVDFGGIVILNAPAYWHGGSARPFRAARFRWVTIRRSGRSPEVAHVRKLRLRGVERTSTQDRVHVLMGAGENTYQIAPRSC